MEIIDLIKEISDEICEGRLAFFLEGGYNLHALADVVGCAVARFNGQSLDTQFDEVVDEDGTGIERVQHAIEIQKKYWTLE